MTRGPVSLRASARSRSGDATDGFFLLDFVLIISMGRAFFGNLLQGLHSRPESARARARQILLASQMLDVLARSYCICIPSGGMTSQCLRWVHIPLRECAHLIAAITQQSGETSD
ncbi:hypothetical protein KC349_g182 [Hortaea werneckii]|nr:hypothetical protein KC349_g182 [Hortaea werneckii]